MQDSRLLQLVWDSMVVNGRPWLTPCGLVSFLLHVKYTILYRIVYVWTLTDDDDT